MQGITEAPSSVISNVLTLAEAAAAALRQTNLRQGFELPRRISFFLSVHNCLYLKKIAGDYNSAASRAECGRERQENQRATGRKRQPHNAPPQGCVF
jgi:hypothetical protein